MARRPRERAVSQAESTSPPRQISEVGLQISALIRRVRQSRGLTLTELAERSGLTKGFLSLIENGRATPSMDSWARIQSALGASLFIPVQQEEHGETATVVRAGDVEELSLLEDGTGTVRRIEVPSRGTFVTDITGLPRTFSGPGVAIGTATVTVLRGELEICIEDDVTRLAAGDWMFFDASRPHSMRRTGPPSTRFLYVLVGSTNAQALDGRYYDAEQTLRRARPHVAAPET